MRKKSLAALLGTAVLALPTVAIGQQPAEKQPQTPATEKPAKAKRGPSVAYNAKGTVKSIDAAGNTVTVAVAERKGSTNKAAKGWRGKDVVFSLAKAKLSLRDTNADGKRDLADLSVGNRVSVVALLPKRLGSVTAPYAAKRLKVHAPAKKQS